jgi:hypothetical protein
MFWIAKFCLGIDSGSLFSPSASTLRLPAMANVRPKTAGFHKTPRRVEQVGFRPRANLQIALASDTTHDQREG